MLPGDPVLHSAWCPAEPARQPDLHPDGTTRHHQELDLPCALPSSGYVYEERVGLGGWVGRGGTGGWGTVVQGGVCGTCGSGVGG